MTELEQLRALVSGASTAQDRDTALAYLASARSRGRSVRDELVQLLGQIEAIEERLVGKRGAQATLEGT